MSFKLEEMPLDEKNKEAFEIWYDRTITNISGSMRHQPAADALVTEFLMAVPVHEQMPRITALVMAIASILLDSYEAGSIYKNGEFVKADKVQAADGVRQAMEVYTNSGLRLYRGVSLPTDTL